MADRFYAADLAYIHDAGFGGYARRLAPEIVRLVRPGRANRKTDERKDLPRVVEFGCGAGTTARMFTREGFRVLGIDISPAMIRTARARAPLARFRAASWSAARIPRCDAIVAIGEVFSYENGTASGARMHKRELNQFFGRAFTALRPGGVLVFDFMASPRGRTYAGRTFAAPGWQITTQATVNGSRRLLTRQIGVTRQVGSVCRRSREVHRVRIYPPAVIRTMLKRAGFAVTLRRKLGTAKVFRGNLAAVCLKPPTRS
jgi:SAM-dependent methyltransferase